MTADVGASVLVVDDDPKNLKLLRVTLSKHGFLVTTAANAGEALEAIAASKPDLVLTDVQLPEIDGLTLTRILKERDETRDIVVIAVTSYAMKGDDEKALAAGCDGYITKPIDTRAIPGILRGYLAARM